MSASPPPAILRVFIACTAVREFGDKSAASTASPGLLNFFPGQLDPILARASGLKNQMPGIRATSDRQQAFLLNKHVKVDIKENHLLPS